MLEHTCGLSFLFLKLVLRSNKLKIETYQFKNALTVPELRYFFFFFFFFMFNTWRKKNTPHFLSRTWLRHLNHTINKDHSAWTWRHVSKTQTADATVGDADVNKIREQLLNVPLQIYLLIHHWFVLVACCAVVFGLISARLLTRV